MIYRNKGLKPSCVVDHSFSIFHSVNTPSCFLNYLQGIEIIQSCFFVTLVKFMDNLWLFLHMHWYICNTRLNELPNIYVLQISKSSMLLLLVSKVWERRYTFLSATVPSPDRKWLINNTCIPSDTLHCWVASTLDMLICSTVQYQLVILDFRLTFGYVD